MTENKLNNLNLFILQQLIRDFFRSKKFLEVQTPPIVKNPGMEPHIHPFQIARAKDKEILNLYLHTSPEFCMKELLSQGHQKIFTQSFCFRDEPNSPLHRHQFLMLEWYRKNETYDQIKEDIVDLFIFLLNELPENQVAISPKYSNFSPEIITVNQLFKKVLNFEILDYLEAHKLLTYIQDNLPQIPLPTSKEDQSLLSWDDLYFLIFLNLIEPKLVDIPFLILDEFPCHLSSLSRISSVDPRFCHRFELYCHGVELANCFFELDDLSEQKERFEKDKKIKSELYNYELPEATVLFNALEKGIGTSSGIALGTERLLGVLTDQKDPFYQ